VPRRLAQALVYSKVRAAVGVRKAVISGGGSLSPHLDTFYEAIGLPVLNGWGLSVRLPQLLRCGNFAPEISCVTRPRTNHSHAWSGRRLHCAFGSSGVVPL
jgi:hypothetical protein